MKSKSNLYQINFGIYPEEEKLATYDKNRFNGFNNFNTASIRRRVY